MKIIQIILILAFGLMIIIYFRRFRSIFLDRLIVLLIGMVGIIAIMFPQLTVRVANVLGVGRGTDLTIYLGLTGLSFVYLLLYSKLRTLESRLTDLARFETIAHSQNPAKNKL